MISLLFISNSPRVELLRVHFQQILKIRIEVVEDFDRGLKDVFEKRPVVVCIQDEIAGVTGESVARHIQLLLSNGAPGFILMHDGNAKAKPVPGLFNHLIDLGAPFEMLCKNIQLALQAQLGDRWDKIYTPPQEVKLEPETHVPDPPAEHLGDAFITANSIFNPQNAPPFPTLETSSSFEDLLDRDLPGGPLPEPFAAVSPEPEASLSQVAVVKQPESSKPIPVDTSAPKIPQQQVAASQAERPVQKTKVVKTVPPAGTMKSSAGDKEPVPVEELLQAFEENYRSNKRQKLRVILAVVALLVVLLLVWALQQGLFKKLTFTPTKQQPVVVPLQKPAPQPVTSSVKAAAKPAQAGATKSDTLPSFIPKAGQDVGFSSNKPGWSRYLSKKRDYRLFKADGRLKALQVLVVGKDSIASVELKLILRELTGSELYRVNSQENRGKLHLERATVAGRAELLIYRSTSRGPVKAFVLQLTP